MIQAPTKSITLDEFLQLEETEPASEYIDGEIIQKPMPQGKHSTIQGELIIAINGVVKPQKIARAFIELQCTFGGQSIVPDVAVFTNHRIPREETGEIANIFLLAPDWIIEILSPEQSQTKVTKKILNCFKFDTQMGWLIDPEEKTIFVYLPTAAPAVFDEPSQQLPVPEFASELQLTLGQVFDWLLE
ncbi:Uma2 family endonuclease [Limnoraphis robusta Tam1]|uniref:Uma2 family endonuclease n=1 Tax=Limnoraphis robusta TaxID=1118279 RepID=UPI002B214D4A|nr:Uma2 family endonuclease [Limnoraphis robusta]MEA5539418.1 Uma2 family endonuclease [Limnoraphis robusta Tam1]